MAKKIVKKAVKKTVKKAVKKAVPAKKKVVKKAAKKATKKVVAKKPVKKVVKKTAKKTAPVKAVKKKVVKKAAKKAVVKAEPRITTICPYLTFAGNCEEAFLFYKSVFGGTFQYLGRFNEMPPMEGQPPMSEADGKMIMHVSLPISKETILMGSDSSEAFGHATVMGNNFSISINAASTAAADRLFNGLSKGGNVTMPLEKTFWGAYFGMLTDKFGIQWMVNFDEQPSK
jgi:PhnB protein